MESKMISRESFKIGEKKALKRARWIKEEKNLQLKKEIIGKYRKTTKLCSCIFCVHNRKIEGKTLSELKSDDSFNDQIKIMDSI
jgi:hypothetical protein